LFAKQQTPTPTTVYVGDTPFFFLRPKVFSDMMGKNSKIDNLEAKAFFRRAPSACNIWIEEIWQTCF